MDKKEILSRAKKEPDEMEYVVLEKSLSLSTIIIPLLSLIFIFIRIINKCYNISDLVLILLSQLLIQEIYRFIKMKNKKTIIILVVLSFLICIFLVSFLGEVSYERFISIKK